MIISEAQHHLLTWATERGLDIVALDARQALDLVLDWYARERADDAEPVDEDGDGILVQWGTYAFDAPPTFQFDVTRQFITAAADEPDETEIWQLHLTVHYPASDATESASGEVWHFDPDAAASTRNAVAELGVLDLLDGIAIRDVIVELDRAD